jgi:hypothetical protein
MRGFDECRALIKFLPRQVRIVVSLFFFPSIIDARIRSSRRLLEEPRCLCADVEGKRRYLCVDGSQSMQKLLRRH